MIRPTDSRPPRRRLAIIEIPRTTAARLGGIGPAPAPPIAWSTISTSAPDSSENWMAMKLREQAYARHNTAGTLQFSPATITEPPPPPPPRIIKDDCSKTILVFGAIGAIGALAYLFSETTRRRTS